MEFKMEKFGKRNVKNSFWGILFILGAVVFLVNKLGWFGEIRFWPIVFTIGLAALFLSGLKEKKVGQVMFSLAFLIIVNDELLGLEDITPWPVLLAAFALTIGVNLLFPGHHKVFAFRVNGDRKKGISSESRDGDAIAYDNTFSSTVKYITGEVSSVRMENSFGSMEVYFGDAVLKNNTARVLVDTSFGGIVLHIPSEWRTIVNVESSFGAVEEKGHCNTDGENTLYVDGEVSFGELEIRYI